MSDRQTLIHPQTPLSEGFQGFNDTPTPALVAGQRLDQPTFHARYAAMPPGTRAELIHGVVYMPSPVGIAHGVAHGPVSMWLLYYVELTPGLEMGDNATTILGRESEPQPDAMLHILPEYGGRTRVEKKMLHGTPELLTEIAHATRYIDLGPKREEYERAGALEYVVRALEPDEVFWFVRVDEKLVEHPPDADGLFRSIHFPGLWLDPQALIKGDTRRLREVLDQGCATPEHAAFVTRLAEARARLSGETPA